MAASPLANSDGILQLSVTSDGMALADTIQLLSVEVTSAINAMPAARIVIADAGAGQSGIDVAVSDPDALMPGQKIKIQAGYGTIRDTVFEGVVTGIGVRISGAQGAVMVVECRDPAVVMTLERKCAHFVNLSDRDVVTRLVASYDGLVVNIDPTALCHSELVQYDVSDWDFLLARAETNGLVALLEGGSLTLKAPATSEAAKLKLTYGVDLIDFEAELGPCATGSASGQLKAAMRRVRGRMQFQGSALAKPGAMTKLCGVGKHFDGDAYLSGVTHTFAEGNWITEAMFGMAPHHVPAPREQAAPLPSGTGAGVAGLQIGVVMQLDQDPEQQCRIQVALPLTGAATASVWARLASHYASDGAGSFFIPEIGDEVVLGFLNNDPSHPLILGSLFGSKRPPPYALSAENAIVTRGKLSVAFDDDSRAIMIATPGGNTLVLSDDARLIELSDDRGNKVTLSPAGIALDSATDIRICAKGKLTLSAAGDIALSANGNLQQQGTNIIATASIGFSASAADSASLSCDGLTSVKGGIVLIN